MATDGRNSRRTRHRKQNSLSAYDQKYDQRNVRYSASPTPGNSASKHHRRNSSLKAKQFKLSQFSNQQNLNIKFTDTAMNKPTLKTTQNAQSIQIPKKTYTINTQTIDTQKSTKQITQKRKKIAHKKTVNQNMAKTVPETNIPKTLSKPELREWELRLTLKESEINAIKSKNLSFIQSLQKQIDSLSKQLKNAQNKNQKHTLSSEDLGDLDSIKRENSKLRATIHRMNDEIKYTEMKRQMSQRENTVNNYYINAINYNNIINNHSSLNIQNNNNNLKWQPLSINEPEPMKREESNSSTWTMKRFQSDQGTVNGKHSIFAINSLSLHAMEKENNRKKGVLDKREKDLRKEWSVYKSQKESFDSERESFEIGQRELFRNNRRLKMKLHQLEILKYEHLLFKTPKLLEMSPTKSGSVETFDNLEIGKFSNIKLNAIKHSISDGYKVRRKKLKELYAQYKHLKHQIHDIEIPNIKKWIKNENKTSKKYSSQITKIINSYIENKKKNNGMMRRFDTKQFDPINLKRTLFNGLNTDNDSEIDIDDDAIIGVTDDTDGQSNDSKRQSHHSQFSFERNTSFDFISDEDQEKQGGTEEAHQIVIESDDQDMPHLNRKRTKSRTMDVDEFTLLSPNIAAMAEREESVLSVMSTSVDNGSVIINATEEEDESSEEEKDTEEHSLTVVQTKDANIGDVDLLRIIKLNQGQNDLLRMKLTELKCTNFNLKSKYEYLKYDKQLLLDQIEELNEVNSELRHGIKEMTSNMRDNGILRQELLKKDTEISNAMVKYDRLFAQYSAVRKNYNTMSALFLKMKTNKSQLISDVNQYRQFVTAYLMEYLWSEWQLINNVQNVLNKTQNSLFKTSLKKTIQINTGNALEIGNKRQMSHINSDINRINFDSKAKLQQFIANLDILPTFKAKNDNSSDNGRSDTYHSITLPPTLKKLEFVFSELLRNTMMSHSSSSLLSNASNKSNANSECHKCAFYSHKFSELNQRLFDIEQEKEDIYLLFSKYKKERVGLFDKIDEYKDLDLKFVEIVQQLRDTQNELDHEREQHSALKTSTEQNLSKMKGLEEDLHRHRQTKSQSLVKEKLDKLLRESKDVLDYIGIGTDLHHSDDTNEAAATPDTTNQSGESDGLVYDAEHDTVNDKTVFFDDEDLLHNMGLHSRGGHSHSGSMVINEEIVQDSKINDVNLNTDILKTLPLKAGMSAMSEASQYGYECDGLSPIPGHGIPGFGMSQNNTGIYTEEDMLSENATNYQIFDSGTKSRQEQKINGTARARLPRDSMVTLDAGLRQQMIDSKKKSSANAIAVIEESEMQIHIPTARRNTVDRLIESRDRQKSNEKIVVISEQKTKVLSPGTSPLSIISIHSKKKQSTDEYYQDMLAKDAINYNESMDFNDIKIEEMTAANTNDALLPNDYPNLTGQVSVDDGFDDDYTDVYGDYGMDANDESPKERGHISSQSSMNRYNLDMIQQRQRHSLSSRHSTQSSLASDGYLELSDTMKISKEQFQELRDRHNKELFQNNPDLVAMPLHEITESDSKEMHRKNQSFDVVDSSMAQISNDEMKANIPKKSSKKLATKHKRNETTVVHIPISNNNARQSSASDTESELGIPQFTEHTRVRHSYNTEDETKLKQTDTNEERTDQPRFGPVHKQNNSIVSDNGTHYISYEHEKELQNSKLKLEKEANNGNNNNNHTTAIINVEQQRIDAIIGNVDISAITAMHH